MNVTTSWINNESNQTVIEASQKSSNTVVAAIYWIIFVVGVSGNMLLLCVRSPNQAATQMFVISLAASDLGLLLGTTWINAYMSLSQNFIFGKVMCKLSQMWAFVAGSCSALILSVIGIDR